MRPPLRNEHEIRRTAITDGERAFRALLALPRNGEPSSIGVDGSGAVLPVPADDARCLLVRGADGWCPAAHVTAESRAVLELYLPVRCHSGTLAVAHLGQSLDGRIATASGDSYYVTGAANLLHLQRMRALCDAVLVGAGTVAADDPRLTVRMEAGPQPVRVVLDPRRRLSADRRVFSDGAATTLLVVDEALAGAGERHGDAEIVRVPVRNGRLALDALLDELRARGLRSVFVEGGGTTVSRFLEAGLLDRLQVAIAPLVIGVGRPGLDVPGCNRMRDCLRAAHRVFRMGDDVLIDCDLRRPPNGGAAATELVRVL
ncbi:MAG TPA: RibD family protein [Gammaproteobacteria bacterium]